MQPRTATFSIARTGTDHHPANIRAASDSDQSILGMSDIVAAGPITSLKEAPSVRVRSWAGEPRTMASDLSPVIPDTPRSTSQLPWGWGMKPARSEVPRL